MNLYDSMMHRLKNLTGQINPKCFAYDENQLWQENNEYKMIFQNDMAYELGGGKKHSANLTCVTTNSDFFDGNQVILYGPDLKDISEPVSFARISEVLVRERAMTGDDEIYKMLQDIDFVKYHIFTDGYMSRTSGQSVREQVRVSKKALKDGVSFEKIGNTYIRHYLDNPDVISVKITFLTTEKVDFSKLEKEADTATQIRRSLSMIQKGLPTECVSCEIKEICNQVEGLKELHFGKKDKKIENSPIT